MHVHRHMTKRDVTADEVANMSMKMGAERVRRGVDRQEVEDAREALALSKQTEAALQKEEKKN